MKPVRAEMVPVHYPAERCCAPGCGDKIKGESMYLVVFDDGTHAYLEPECIPCFVDGHPDYGHGFGWCDGLRRGLP